MAAAATERNAHILRTQQRACCHVMIQMIPAYRHFSKARKRSTKDLVFPKKRIMQIYFPQPPQAGNSVVHCFYLVSKQKELLLSLASASEENNRRYLHGKEGDA